MRTPTRPHRLVAAAIAVVAVGSADVAGAGGPMAVLQGLNKITARVSEIEAPIDEVVRFGTLEITARTCYKAPPEEPPESASFLEIVDVKPGEAQVDLFSGWMFASSPALSALEHPVYDIWVLDCREAEGPSIPEAPSPSSE